MRSRCRSRHRSRRREDHRSVADAKSSRTPTVAERALELAQTNGKNRPTVEAQRMVSDAAIAAGNTKLACATAEALSKGEHVPPEAQVSEARAFTACGQKDRAAAELAKLNATP